MAATDAYYWIIDYRIDFLSDFHVGSGITLVGGNLFGLELDARGLPLIPHTEIRGLLRLGGRRLEEWCFPLAGYCDRNFGARREPDRDPGYWSFTGARFRVADDYSSGLARERVLGAQSHVRLSADEVVENLFACQKAGAGGVGEGWCGRIYSRRPLPEREVAFLAACMRAEDRVGHRRSRGYGRVDWRIKKLHCYLPGGKLDEVTSNSPEELLDGLLEYLFGRMEVNK